MRKRKRDWPQRVLLYRAYPAALPQALWDTAKLQQAVWNQLVAAWQLAAELAATWRHFGLDREAKTTWQRFELWARATVSRTNAGLDWVNGPALHDRLSATAKAHRRPQFHRGLQQIAIAYRFTMGGIALAKLVDNQRMSRFYLRSSKNWVPTTRPTRTLDNPHWRGRFAVADTAIDFALALHRPLPAGAILKSAAWLGKYAARQWRWYLALTIEEPPRPVPAHTSKLSAGLDLGWRLFGEGTKHDYLRIGMLNDSEGRAIELRLPLWLRPNRKAERRGLATLAELRGDADNALLAAKQILGYSENYNLGARGLRTLVQETAAPELAELLKLHQRASERHAFLQFKLRQRRRWYYQNLAQFCCQRYRVIALEGDMVLAPLHARTTDPALMAAAKYRNYAASGELRGFMRTAAAKWGTTLLEAEAAYSTTTCWLCGAAATGGGSLDLTCAAGHRWDQDQNAARNLLAQIDHSFGQTHVLRNLFSGRNWKRLIFPETIRAIAVEVPAR